MINPLAKLDPAEPFAAVQSPEPARPAPASPPEPNTRLTIDASPHGLGFVYTLQDRATGRIIAQLPRHEAETLAESPGYQAGDLVRAKA